MNPEAPAEEGALPREGGAKVSQADLALAQETTSYYGWLNILCYNVGPTRISLNLDEAGSPRPHPRQLSLWTHYCL